MDFRLRHGAAITLASALLVGTAAAQSNLGWTWSKTLTLPGDREGGSASFAMSSRSSYQSFWRASSSIKRYGPYGSSHSSQANGVPSDVFLSDDDRPLTQADLRRYHEEIVRPLQEAVMCLQSGLPPDCAISAD